MRHSANMQLLLAEQLTDEHLVALTADYSPGSQFGRIDALIDYGIAAGDQTALDEAEAALGEVQQSDSDVSDLTHKAALRQAYMPTFRARAERQTLPIEETHAARIESLAEHIQRVAPSEDGVQADDSRRGQLGELAILLLLPHANPSVRREAEERKPFNHDCYTAVDDIKIPLEVKYMYKRGVRSFGQDRKAVLQLLVMQDLRELVMARHQAVTLSEECLAEIQERSGIPFGLPLADLSFDNPLVRSNVNAAMGMLMRGIAKQSRRRHPSPSEAEIGSVLRQVWERKIALFCRQTNLLPPPSMEKIAHLLD